MHLQAAGPIPDSIRHAFVAYLAGHRRSIAELLQPNREPIEDLFANHFADLTEDPVELEKLEAARTQLFEWVASALTDNERRFLRSIKQGEPDWSLLPFEGLDRWPAIQWKLRNIQLMSDRRHEAAIRRLRKVLDLGSKDSVNPCRDSDTDPRSVGRRAMLCRETNDRLKQNPWDNDSEIYRSPFSRILAAVAAATVGIEIAELLSSDRSSITIVRIHFPLSPPLICASLPEPF